MRTTEASHKQYNLVYQNLENIRAFQFVKCTRCFTQKRLRKKWKSWIIDHLDEWQNGPWMKLYHYYHSLTGHATWRRVPFPVNGSKRKTSTPKGAAVWEHQKHHKEPRSIQWLEHGSGNSFLVCPWTKNKSMISSRVMLAVSVGKLVFSVITSLNSL